MAAVLLQIKLKFKVKKQGPDIVTRQLRKARQAMTLAAQVKQEGAEDRARQCLDWFMHESAYQFLKVSKFKYTIAVVIKLQRAYRAIKFRRVV